MPEPIEDQCCGRATCITQYEMFQLVCLHPAVLRVAIRNNCYCRADPYIYDDKAHRKATYCQYILWAYGHLGRGNRRVVCMSGHQREIHISDWDVHGGGTY